MPPALGESESAAAVPSAVRIQPRGKLQHPCSNVPFISPILAIPSNSLHRLLMVLRARAARADPAVEAESLSVGT